METPNKLLLLGIGAVAGGIILAIGALFRLFPHRDRYFRLWTIVIIPALVVGTLFIILAQK